MSNGKPVFLIESNDFVAMKVSETLKFYGLGEQVQIVSPADNMEDSAVIAASIPFRMGQILDQISGYLNPKGSDENILNIGDGTVDIDMGFYHAHENSEPVRLTEKEVALLVLLAQAKGGDVSRESLLEDVWKYADGVETHTLETHIYRLRQKIERDPANPQILLTGDAGYSLRF